MARTDVLQARTISEETGHYLTKADDRRKFKVGKRGKL